MPAYLRAFRYLSTRRGKAVLLLLVLTTLLALMLVGIAVYRASDAAAMQLRETMGGYFRVAPDQRKTRPTVVNAELVERIAGIDGVAAANGMDVHYLMTPDLDLIPGRFTAEGDPKRRMARFLGNTDSASHEYFQLGLLEVESGRHVRAGDEGVALVSSALAEANSLAIGDMVTAEVTADLPGAGRAEGSSYDVEVVGIFVEARPTPADSGRAEVDLPANFIFVDEATSRRIGREWRQDDETVYSAGVVFRVADPQRIDEIVAAALAVSDVGWDGLEVTVNNSSYQRSVASMTRMATMASLMVGVVGALGLGLLTLLLTMWERDRVREVAVLMSCGIRKRSILAQHLIEVISVFLVALVLSAAVAWPTVGLAHRVLAPGSEPVETSQGEAPPPAIADPLADAGEPEVEMQAGLTAADLGWTGVGGLVIIGASLAVSFASIVRRKPKDLLSVME